MRTRASWLVVIVVGAIAAVATVDAVVGSVSEDDGVRREVRRDAPAVTTSPLDSQHPVVVEPVCGDGRSCRAEWVRRFVRAAGFRITGETGGASIARGGGSSFFIWAANAVGAGGQWDEGYRRVAHVGAKGIYTDGVRFSWTARGSRVWLEPGPAGGEPEPSRATLASLVRASVRVSPPIS